MKALFYDDLDSGEGCVVREYIDENTALMGDGQHFHYNFSITEDKLACPKCHNFDDLVFKGDGVEFVSEGYICTCTNCDEDFYLMEVTKNGNE